MCRTDAGANGKTGDGGSVNGGAANGGAVEGGTVNEKQRCSKRMPGERKAPHPNPNPNPSNERRCLVNREAAKGYAVGKTEG